MWIVYKRTVEVEKSKSFVESAIAYDVLSIESRVEKLDWNNIKEVLTCTVHEINRSGKTRQSITDFFLKTQKNGSGWRLVEGLEFALPTADVYKDALAFMQGHLQ